MAYYLSPIGNNSQTSTSGAPLSGGFIYTYAAGTSTPQTTYTDSTGGTPQANPIVLNTYGLPSSPIWLTGSQAYKFQIKDSLGNLIRTIDTVYGINDPTGTALTNNFSGSITAPVAGSALSIALKTASGADPSASEPVYVAFRSATAGTGTVLVRAVTAALSITIPSGATMGQTNNAAARLWVAAIDNGGTVELAVVNTQMGSGQLFAVNESSLISTTALSAASSSAGVWYSTSARTTVPFHLVGYVENVQTTAGTWATNPSVIQPVGPGVRKPGDTVQQAGNFVGAFTTDTTIIPADNTIPQNTEGFQYLSQSLTPASSVNTLRITAQWIGASNAVAGSIITAALFQDATANALKTAFGTPGNAAYVVIITLYHQMAAGTSSATTLRLRAGASAAGTTTFNGTGGAQLMGGTADSFIQVTEIMA